MPNDCELCHIYIYDQLKNIEKCELCNLLEYYLIVFKFLLIITFILLIFILKLN